MRRREKVAGAAVGFERSGGGTPGEEHVVGGGGRGPRAAGAGGTGGRTEVGCGEGTPSAASLHLCVCDTPAAARPSSFPGRWCGGMSLFCSGAEGLVPLTCGADFEVAHASVRASPGLLRLKCGTYCDVGPRVKMGSNGSPLLPGQRYAVQ